MYNGSCLCGEVKFEISGKISNIVFCHCSRCRKAQGTAFATNGNLEEKHFKIIKGKLPSLFLHIAFKKRFQRGIELKKLLTTGSLFYSRRRSKLAGH